MTARIEMIRELFDIDGPSVRWGFRVVDGKDVIHERLPSADIAQHEWQAKAEADAFADSIGLPTKTKDEVLAEIDAMATKVEADATAELQRLTDLRKVAARRDGGFTRAEAERVVRGRGGR